MKVLHLVGTAEDTGGILSVIRSLSESIGDRSTHALWVNERFAQKRSPALDLRRSRWARDENPSHLRLLAAAVRAWPELRRLLREEPFDVVHGHSRGAFPLVLGLAAAGWSRLLYTNHTYARRIGLYRRASEFRSVRWVFLTPNMLRHYRVRPGLGRVETISACVGDAFFTTALPSSPPNRLHWVGFGSLVRWKRWDLAAAALRLLPEPLRARVTVTVHGPTPDDPDARLYAEELRSLAAAPDLAGSFIIAPPTNAVAAALAAADGLILPSTNEPCSVAVMEALASGKPVLVSASGGNVDLVRDRRTGLLFEPDSRADLARALTEAAEGRFIPDPPEALRESVRARSATEIGRRYLALYRELRATAGPVR